MTTYLVEILVTVDADTESTQAIAIRLDAHDLGVSAVTSEAGEQVLLDSDDARALERLAVAALARRLGIQVE